MLTQKHLPFHVLLSALAMSKAIIANRLFGRDLPVTRKGHAKSLSRSPVMGHFNSHET